MSEELTSYITTDNYDAPCKLCCQFVHQTENNIFHKIFQPSFDPIIREYKYFSWVVGIGQITEGYTLLVPKRHIFSFSQLNKLEWEEFNSIFNEIIPVYKDTYPDDIIIFEHGCEDSYSNSGSCISHAHLHLVPIAEKQKFIKKIAELWQLNSINRIQDLSIIHDEISPYLFFGIPNKELFFVINRTYNIQSQYFRKLLCTIDTNLNNWNWRTYIGREEILSTIDKLKSSLFKNLDLTPLNGDSN